MGLAHSRKGFFLLLLVYNVILLLIIVLDYLYLLYNKVTNVAIAIIYRSNSVLLYLVLVRSSVLIYDTSPTVDIITINSDIGLTK